MTFDRETLPYGVFSVDGGPRRIGVAVDDGVLELAEHLDPSFAAPSLNALMAQGRARWDEVRANLDRVLSELERLVAAADDKTLQSWAPTLGRIANHNAYHTGQILVLRKMQGAWDAAKGVK